MAECKRWVDCKEYIKWLIIDGIAPIGLERADYQAAIIASTIANVNRGKNVPPFVVTDPMFMPFLEQNSGDGKEQPRKQSDKEVSIALGKITGLSEEEMARVAEAQAAEEQAAECE